MKEKYGATLTNYHISDYNWDLFVLYSVIKSRVSDLVGELRALSDEYILPPTQKGDKEGERISMYKRVRNEYNDDEWERIRFQDDGRTFRRQISESWVRRAAMTIFRTGPASMGCTGSTARGSSMSHTGGTTTRK